MLESLFFTLMVGVLLFVVIYGLFWWMGKTLNNAHEEHLMDWLQGNIRGKAGTSLSVLVHIFSSAQRATLGGGIMGGRLIVATVTLSFLGLFFVVLCSANIAAGDFIFYLFVYLLLVPLNLLKDYLSIIKSRFLVSFVKPQTFLLVTIGTIAVDFLLCGLIFSLIAYLMAEFYPGLMYGPLNEAFFTTLIRESTSFSTLHSGLSLGPFFATTFVPVIWLLTFIAGGYGIRALSYVGLLDNGLPMFGKTSFKQIGAAAGGMSALIFWTFAF